MGKTRITGVVFGPDAMEWATVEASSGRVQAAGEGQAALSAELAIGKDGATQVQADAALRAQMTAWRGAVVLGLPSRQVLLRVSRFPESDPAELRGMVELQIDKVAPFPIETMIVSHEVLDTREGQSTVLMAAVKTDVVEAAGRILLAGGVAPARVDAEILGRWTLLREGGHVPAEGRHAALFAARGGADLVVFDAGTPVLLRWIETPPDASDEEVAREVAAEVGYSLMNVEMEAGDAAPGVLTVWHENDEEPATLLKALRGVCAFDVRAGRAQTLGRACAGLARRALAGQAGLDLRSAAWVERAHTRRVRRSTGAVVAVFLGLWLLVMGAAFGGVAYQRHKLARLNERLQEGRKPANDVREMRRRTVMIQRYKDTKTSALECLREMSVQQPEGVEITSFSYRKGENVKLSGEAGDVNMVYTFKNQLDAGGLYRGSTLTGPTVERSRRRAVFSIDLALPGGAAE